jgi:hypothetical protein
MVFHSSVIVIRNKPGGDSAHFCWVKISYRGTTHFAEVIDGIANSLSGGRLNLRCVRSHTSSELGNDLTQFSVLAYLCRGRPSDDCKQQRDGNSHLSIHCQENRFD